MSSAVGGFRGSLLAGAASLAFALACGPACAGDQPAPASPDVQALQAEIEQLKALVKSQAEHDQQQIDALSAQVRSLKEELQQQTPVATNAPQPGQLQAQQQPQKHAQQEAQQSSPQQALPRAAQTPPGEFAAQARPLPPPNPRVAEPRVAQNSTHRLLLQSEDGAYSIGLTGDIQIDTGGYNFTARNAFVGPQALSNGLNARRARIGVVGTAAGVWSFGLVYDAGNSQDTTPKGIQTAQIVYGGLKGAAFELGYSNTFFTLDQSTSSNDLLFLERSSPSNIATNFNAGDARSNAGARFFGKRYWIGAYLTGPQSGDSHTLTAERFGAFERVAVQAVQGKDHSLHLGVAVDQLIQAPNSGNGTPNTLTLSDQPELRIDPTTLLNTGTIGSAAHPVTGGVVYNLETAATWKGLYWQGEYYHYQVSRSGLPNNDFDGYYGQIAWTLTGETRTYNQQAASYFRIYPARPFNPANGDWGALELAARLDYVNLNSRFVPGVALSAIPGAVDGGAQHGFTFGLNWYPNDLVRFMLDYNHILYDKENGTKGNGADLGVPVGSRFDALSLRAQVAY